MFSVCWAGGCWRVRRIPQQSFTGRVEKGGAPRVGTQPRRSGGSKGGGPRRVGGPKISRFFSFSRRKFHSFFFGVFEGRSPKMCTFGLSGCRVKPWKTPRETQKERNGGGRGKKTKFWAVRRRGVQRRGLSCGRWSREVQTNNQQPQPQQRQTQKKWGPEGSAPSPKLGFRSLGFGLFWFRKFGQNTETLKLAKVGLAKVGRAPLFLGLALLWLWLLVVGLDFPGPPSAGQPPSAEPPSAGPPKISLFFPLPPPFRSFCVSQGVFRGFTRQPESPNVHI